MGDTGLEPIDTKGLAVYNPGASRVHSEEHQHVAPELSGHTATAQEHPKDVQEHAPCGTGVARKIPPDLAELAEFWDRLPEALRHSWLLTAKMLTAANPT